MGDYEFHFKTSIFFNGHSRVNFSHLFQKFLPFGPIISIIEILCSLVTQLRKSDLLVYYLFLLGRILVSFFCLKSTRFFTR